MKLAEPFATKFGAEKLIIFATDHWSVLVRKPQVTIGSVVLAANRCFISASDLNADELAEFPKIVGKLEKMLAKAFNYDKINYLCLMMVDRHYHFHVIPRYESTREFCGIQWVDSAWPKPPNLAVPDIDEETALKLKVHLTKYL